MLIRVPATTANLGPGFDSLGMALQLYNTMEITESDTLMLPRYSGMQEEEVHLTYMAMQRVWKELGIHEKTIKLCSCDRIPIGKGLGSSSACIVAGLLAANRMEGDLLPLDRLLALAADMEGHPDNVLPALLGGFTAGYWDGEILHYLRFPPPKGIRIVMYIPDSPLMTSEARRVLPDSYSRKDAVFNVAHAAMTAAAIAGGKPEALAFTMSDRLHQPYRKPLIPGWYPLEKLLREAGALAICISGAGPSMMTLWQEEIYAPMIVPKEIPGNWKAEEYQCDIDGAIFIDEN
ncbi:MAG: homoserine kinase [Christensenellales bacterium]|jgi:homoserine kinase